MSDSLQPHGLQHTRLPYPSPTPRACSNSCPLSQWCHPTISSPVIPFSYCLRFPPASGSFQMSQFSHQMAKVWEGTKRFLETALVLGCCSSWDLRSALPYPKIPGRGGSWPTSRDRSLVKVNMFTPWAPSTFPAPPPSPPNSKSASSRVGPLASSDVQVSRTVLDSASPHLCLSKTTPVPGQAQRSLSAWRLPRPIRPRSAPFCTRSAL